jgi:hypothetical protein
MTPSFSHTDWRRSRLVVLSDRRPPPGGPRTAVEAAIERALREHDGAWLARHADAADAVDAAPAPAPAPPERAAWSALDAAPAAPHAAAEAWAGYVRANLSYAERVIEMMSPGGTVWILGQPWLLVAASLREHGHRGPIGLVLDAAFPAPDRLRELPWHAELMAALCQLDLIELRTPECAARLEACLARTGRTGRARPASHVVRDGTEADPTAWGTAFLHMLASAARRRHEGAMWDNAPSHLII